MVTGICIGVENGRGGMCNMAVARMLEIMSISANHASISGTLSKHHYGEFVESMWESVVNRAIRMLASGPFGPLFFLASVSISGN
ncbi:hypothetical protein KIN20_026708 [Parelaphostrongylus tenuis]|uniref:Uncharacterized protein n=1 Tax=Parelaphostrongylus tenuis TaxID=148309 RepID=A0AAD5WDA7_PARTN|nr:hypothetical protein KIN20_026708 [Parelaphostrongylus tenuis]